MATYQFLLTGGWCSRDFDAPTLRTAVKLLRAWMKDKKPKDPGTKKPLAVSGRTYWRGGKDDFAMRGPFHSSFVK